VKRALITGVTGFAGGHLTAHLLELGNFEVHGVALDEGCGLDFLSRQVPVKFANLQVSQDVETLLQDIRPDHIYHLAAQACVPVAWRDPWGTFENNVRPELNLLQAMVTQRLGARLLVVASNEVYGAVPPEQLPVKEDAPLRPVNPYGVSKVAQDVLALQYHLSHGVDVLRVRAFNHLGPRQSPQFVAASFARQIAEAEAGLRPPLLKVGNLDAQRDFTDVTDVVRAYALLMEKGEPGQAYNIGSGRARSVRCLLDVLLGMSTVAIQIEQDPDRTRPVDAPIIVADVTRLRAATGWAPTISFEESLRRVLDYWRQVISGQATNPGSPGCTYGH
jgi:GDP-4-dehydro-6-deoxy-D-mannose reductase